MPRFNSWVNTYENLKGYELYGTKDHDYFIVSKECSQKNWFNQTLNPKAFSTSLNNSVNGDITQTLIKLNAGSNSTEVIQQILMATESIPGLENLTIFDLKEEVLKK